MGIWIPIHGAMTIPQYGDVIQLLTRKPFVSATKAVNAPMIPWCHALVAGINGTWVWLKIECRQCGQSHTPIYGAILLRKNSQKPLDSGVPSSDSQPLAHGHGDYGSNPAVQPVPLISMVLKNGCHDRKFSGLIPQIEIKIQLRGESGSIGSISFSHNSRDEITNLQRSKKRGQCRERLKKI